jgi:hypothetical protein
MEARGDPPPPDSAPNGALSVSLNGSAHNAGPFSIQPDGRYRQRCRCATRRAIAERTAERLARQAEDAYRDAAACETEDDTDGAIEFRAHGRELEDRVAQIVADLPADGAPCAICAGTREVIGNGTYGGPGKRQRVVMTIL